MTTLDPRLAAAVGIGQLASFTSRRLGRGGGTSLPGLLAERIDREVLSKLTRRLPRGVVLVTGTNGKTTTSRLLSAMLDQAGWRIVHNRAGANLVSGLASALIDRSNLLGASSADGALFEVDEAVMPGAQLAILPRVIVLTNLFRDQLDRYGEIDYVAGVWRQVMARLPEDVTVVLNADDPALAALGLTTAARVTYYGVETDADPGATLDHTADSKNCPLCGRPLEYTVVRYAHLGRYACPAGDFRRPEPQIALRRIRANGDASSDLQVTGPFGEARWRLPLPGLYNAYNVLAAVAGATALDLPFPAIDAGARSADAAFGRFERIAVGDQAVCFALVKNPVGLTEVLRTILGPEGEKDLAIMINDNLADGTDVSWLWDAKVESLVQRCRRVTVSGTRVGDIAVRLKYAGLPPDRIQLAETIESGFDRALAQLPSGQTLYVLPTYTAMLELRTLVGRRGYAQQVWEK